jgi:hypothetical protein
MHTGGVVCIPDTLAVLCSVHLSVTEAASTPPIGLSSPFLANSVTYLPMELRKGDQHDEEARLRPAISLQPTPVERKMNIQWTLLPVK